MEYLNTTKSDVSTNVAHDFIGAWDLVRDKKTQPYVMVVDANFIKNQTNLTIDDGYNFSTVNGLKRDHKYYDLGESGYAIHGFSVASVIGATTNNNIGIAGGSTDVKIMALKALHDGHCSGFDIADAVRYASGDTHFDRINTPILPILTSKPDVINISAGTSYPEGTPIEQSKCSNFMQSALDMAFDAGISVVVSAGNSTQQIALITPANCNHVITVTALDKTGDIAYYSNYGKGV